MIGLLHINITHPRSAKEESGVVGIEVLTPLIGFFFEPFCWELQANSRGSISGLKIGPFGAMLDRKARFLLTEAE